MPCRRILSVNLQNQALQILSLGDIEDYRVVWGRPAAFQQANPALGIARCGRHHAMKFIPGNMVRAGAGHQRPPRTQHLKRAQIELFVTAEGTRHRAFGFGKSRGIEHHRVKGVARGAPIAEKIKSVGLDPFHRGLDAVPVDLKILFRHLECGARGVDSSDVGTGPGQVQCEAALVSANIESLATGIARCRGIVQALVKKGARLLPGIGVVVKSQPIQVKNGRQLGNGLGGIERFLRRFAQLLQFADAGIGPLDDRDRRKF
jgi:hypothetical protein